MSQSRIFDIILIGLAVVILLHLFYNNSLFSTPKKGGNKEGMMNSLEFPSIHDVSEDLLSRARNNGGKLTDNRSEDAQSVSDYDAHSAVRDQGPIQQTQKSETPYYHVTNNSVNSDNDPKIDVVDSKVPVVNNKVRGPNTIDETQKRGDGTLYTKDEIVDNCAKERNTRECNIQSDGDNGYHKFCNNNPSKLRTLGRRRKVNRSGSYQDYVDRNKLVFADNYEGRLTSDPFDADAVQVNMSGMNMRGFLGNNPFEAVKDVKGNKCNLDPEMENLKRYIREFVLDGRDQCYCATDPSKSEFTRDEIDRYREQQIGFRDKINGTSRDFEDAVDKMNEVTMTGIKAKNQSIANFYDSIVENKFDRQLKGGYKLTHRVGNLDGPGFIMGTTIPSDDCVKPPELDLRAAIPTGNYTQTANSGGRFFLRDNFMYTNENPNNGGFDSSGVTGQDPMMDPRLIIS